MKISNITIYGAGLIGSGWTTFLLLKGSDKITLYDINDDAIQRGLHIIDENFSVLQRERVLSAQQICDLKHRIKTTTDAKKAVENADLIIENGPEVVEIKRQIINTIETYCKREAIITSSTSGILLSEITNGAKNPERIIGMHPYHPVYLIPLLEISKNETTDPQKLSEITEFFESIQKKPVILKKESDGYIGSRLMTTLLRESVSMILSGICTMEDIDNAFTYGPGMRYALFGIFTTLQLAGGEKGLEGLLCGPIGQSTDKWISHFCNWEHWPEEARMFFKNSQKEMDILLSKRDHYHGKTNDELTEFRDHGLVKILQAQQMI